MQSINIGGQLTCVNGNIKTVISLTDSFTTTGSNSLSNTANIVTSSWVTIDQGSDTNFRYGYFTNASTSSTIQVAVGSTGSYALFLQPGDIGILANSGSAVLYAYASGSQSPALLGYFVTEQ
jgi:hypothetical protein